MLAAQCDGGQPLPGQDPGSHVEAFNINPNAG